MSTSYFFSNYFRHVRTCVRVHDACFTFHTYTGRSQTNSTAVHSVKYSPPHLPPTAIKHIYHQLNEYDIRHKRHPPPQPAEHDTNLLHNTRPPRGNRWKQMEMAHCLPPHTKRTIPSTYHIILRFLRRNKTRASTLFNFSFISPFLSHTKRFPLKIQHPTYTPRYHDTADNNLHTRLHQDGMGPCVIARGRCTNQS